MKKMNKILLVLIVISALVFCFVPSASAEGMPDWELQFYTVWGDDTSKWDTYTWELFERAQAAYANETATATATPTTVPTTATPTAVPTTLTPTTVPTTATPTVVPTTVVPTTVVPTTAPTTVTPTVVPTTATPTAVPTTAAPAENITAVPGPSVPVLPIVTGVVVILLVGAAAMVIIKRRTTVKKYEDAYVPVESVYDIPTVEPKAEPTFVPVTEEPEVIPVVPEAEAEKESEPEYEPEPVYAPTRPILPPKEIYAQVLTCLAKKYSIRHAETLTPRQLISLAEPTPELTEFVALYERIRYAPSVGAYESTRLAELADRIFEQYSS